MRLVISHNTHNAGPSHMSRLIRTNQDCLWGNAICFSFENPAVINLSINLQSNISDLVRSATILSAKEYSLSVVDTWLEAYRHGPIVHSEAPMRQCRSPLWKPTTSPIFANKYMYAAVPVICIAAQMAA